VFGRRAQWGRLVTLGLHARGRFRIAPPLHSAGSSLHLPAPVDPGE
jgi:hypothetical protein